MNQIKFGKYQHYKTQKNYEVIGVAQHSETLLARMLYGSGR